MKQYLIPEDLLKFVINQIINSDIKVKEAHPVLTALNQLKEARVIEEAATELHKE